MPVATPLPPGSWCIPDDAHVRPLSISHIARPLSRWFHRDVDLCCVPSDAVRHLAERAGLQSKANPSGESKSETLAQVRQHGLPLRVGFARPEARSRAEMRTLLGIELDTPTVLVVGGGDGVGGIETVAQAIGARLGADIEAAGSASKGDRRQMVVVCGKNEVARTGLESTTWHEGVSVKVCGFVNNMDEWMAVADCLVTKAGPGTIAEACARGLPVRACAPEFASSSISLPSSTRHVVDRHPRHPRGSDRSSLERSGSDSGIASCAACAVDAPPRLLIRFPPRVFIARVPRVCAPTRVDLAFEFPPRTGRRKCAVCRGRRLWRVRDRA